MASIERVGDLEIDQDMPFQERMWRAQRVGWAIMALLLVAALLGAFGTGLLSRATAESGPLQVQYDRFVRFESPAQLEVRVAPGAAGDDVRVTLSHEYLRHLLVEHITPQPEQVLDGGGRLTYVFALAGAGEPAEITFHLRPERPGLLHAQVGLTDGQPTSFTQFVYP